MNFRRNEFKYGALCDATADDITRYLFDSGDHFRPGPRKLPPALQENLMVSIWLRFRVFGQECFVLCSFLVCCQLANREDSLLNPFEGRPVPASGNNVVATEINYESSWQRRRGPQEVISYEVWKNNLPAPRFLCDHLLGF